MFIKVFTVGPMDNRMYVIGDEGASQCFIVDPGFGAESVIEELRRQRLQVDIIVNTHAHLDHIAANAAYAEAFGCPVALHPAELPLLRAVPEQAEWFGVPTPATVQPSVMLDDGQRLFNDEVAAEVMHLPGHSPGHVCLKGPGWVIVGDVVFAGSIGRTDLPGGDYPTLMRSIHRRLLTLPDETILYPGHGPETTVGAERKSNPFLVEGGHLWT